MAAPDQPAGTAHGAADAVPSPTIHASALLIGRHGLLIRGPSGSGKSQLTLALLQAASLGAIPGFARLVGDDRIHLQAVHGRLLMRPAQTLQGQIEVRGLGIVRLPYEPVAVASLVIDLDAPDGARLPQETALQTCISNVVLARLPVAPGADPVALLRCYCLGKPELKGLTDAG